MQWLRSALMQAEGFSHAFTTRLGGVSRGPFASLNLGRGLGDEEEAVSQNHVRLAEALGYAPGDLHEVEQVHGDRHLLAAGAPGDTATLRADALLARSGVVGPVAIRTADCVPLLLACPRSGDVAAVHAGWRGAVKGALPKATRALLALDPDSRPGDLLVALGPHIRVDAFEVGEDVAAEIAAAAPRGVRLLRPLVERRGGRRYANLAALLCAQLQQLGVKPLHIEDVGGCTFSEPLRFFSHRRDAGRTGRQLAVILPRG